MNLCERMMQPGRFDLGGNSEVTPMKVNQSIHLRGDVLGRTVFMDRPIRPRWTVRPSFVSSKLQRSLNLLSKLIDAFHGALMLKQSGVQFLDVPDRQFPLAFNE